MIATLIYLAVSCIGNMILVGVIPDYYGNDREKHAEPQGYKYEVMLPSHKYDKLVIKIPGKQLLDAPVSGAEPMVEFADLRVRPYVDHAGRMAYTASATSIKVVDSGSGKTGKA